MLYKEIHIREYEIVTNVELFDLITGQQFRQRERKPDFDVYYDILFPNLQTEVALRDLEFLELLYPWKWDR
jgi:hypothetical protein